VILLKNGTNINKNNNKFNLYGRARRLALIQGIAFVVMAISMIIFIISNLPKNRQTIIVEDEFSKLTVFFENRNYLCEPLQVSGGKCILTSDNVKKTFYRFNDGFQFIVVTDSYTLTIAHRLSEKAGITFKTTSKAFEGYKNQVFTCDIGTSVLDDFGTCSSKETVLDIASYIGIIEEAQIDINNALIVSEYSIEELLTNYVWKQKE
jgi:hypothetical protein